jgi:hypothetical protein
MLGLMSVMALTTMSIAVKKREQARQQTAVELVGVPSGFLPFHVRCTAEEISWLNDRHQWRTVSLVRLWAWLRLRQTAPIMSSDVREFLTFLRLRTQENARLSFSGRQNTMILWVQPDGIDGANIVQMAVGELNLPLRIGKLPIQPNEEIKRDAGIPR